MKITTDHTVATTSLLLFLQDLSLEPKLQNRIFNTCGNILLVLIQGQPSSKSTVTESALKLLNILSTDNDAIQKELFQTRETFLQLAFNSEQSLVSRKHSLWIVNNLLPSFTFNDLQTTSQELMSIVKEDKSDLFPIRSLSLHVISNIILQFSKTSSKTHHTRRISKGAEILFQKLHLELIQVIFNREEITELRENCLICLQVLLFCNEDNQYNLFEGYGRKFLHQVLNKNEDSVIRERMMEILQLFSNLDVIKQEFVEKYVTFLSRLVSDETTETNKIVRQLSIEIISNLKQIDERTSDDLQTAFIQYFGKSLIMLVLILIYLFKVYLFPIIIENLRSNDDISHELYKRDFL